jgi:hypothetical protein
MVTLVAWLACVCGAAALSAAQTPPPPAGAVVTEDEFLEAYLADRELWTVLAAHLRSRLGAGASEDRSRAAESLGRLYAKMLAETMTPEQRQRLEGQCRELLRQVPEADSFELRINLAKAEYLRIEEIVEKDRLRLATAEDKAEADRALRHLGPMFEEIAAKTGRRVEQLEKKETLAKDDAVEGVRVELADARRLRSLARYYSGWTSYYSAVLNKTPGPASRALEDFGALLNAVPGKPASIERMPKHLLRFEHVARAAIGCALACSLLGRDTEAARWLDEVEQAEGVPPAVLDQVFARRLIVSATAQRWADAELEVRRRRKAEDGSERLLSVVDARLAAVLALDAARDPSLRPGMKAAAEKVSQVAMSDLIKRGEIGQILDLVQAFGTAPIGGDGFIVAYVRGLQAFESARAAHKASGENPEQPTGDPALVNRYREAAGLLAAAPAAADAARFGSELPRAMIREGLAWYYAGDVTKAAPRFEAAAQRAGSGDARRDALWYAVVSLDKAIETGQLSAAGTRDRLATLYIQEFPGTDNAAKLLLRQTRADALSPAQTIDVLLKVPADSPLHEAARRQAARLLYQEFRRVPTDEKSFAALRFAEVVEPLMRSEHARALGVRDAAGAQAADALILHARQLADALLAAPAPDLQRVEAALSMLESAADAQRIDLRPFEPELAFRRLQVALARSDEAGVQRLLDRLRESDPKFSTAADRLLYRRAFTRWRENSLDPALAREVVRHGARLIDQARGAANDATVVSLREAVAAAAAVGYRADRDVSLRDLAIRLDREQLEGGTRAASSLRRLGELLEDAGDPDAALAAWQELLAGLDPASAGWYEARYQSLRLLLRADPRAAADAMRQHVILHPEYGPEPWGSQLRALEKQMPAPTPAPVPAQDAKRGGP